MKAKEAKLLDFLRSSSQFIIPIYQRTYSWTEGECRQLWDDILRCGSNDKIAVHFIGSIVYIEQGLSQVTHHSPLLVIDGQQRLTTVTLLLAALAETVGDKEPVDGFSAKKLRNYYLLNDLESEDRRFKLLLSQTDKDSLKALVAGSELPREHSIRITENYTLFKQLLAESASQLNTICQGIAKLVVVDIALSRGQDNPQLIFESMNSTGKELSQADLIRNYVLMGLEPKLQDKLYQEHWRPMELEFGQEAYGTDFDSFMRHYLTVKSGEIPNISAVYEAFKKHAFEVSSIAQSDEDHTETIVKDLRAFSRYYCCMALGKEADPELRRAFDDLKELKVDVAFPFLLQLYSDYANTVLNKADFVQAVRLVESYVFRRSVCNIPTNSMNKTFATFGNSLKKDRYLESIKAHFLLLQSYRCFPTDEEFQRDIQVRNLYGFRSRVYWLRRIENHNRKELVPIHEYTIEHIMPQNPDLNQAWRNDLGPDWERVHAEYLHTLGNLTLTGYNSEYSDRSFQEKHDMPGGFKDSPLKLNAELRTIAEWNEQTIKQRARRLSAEALTIWQAPKLDRAVLDGYRKKQGQPQTTYSIEDHPYLLRSGIRELFEAFRKEVLALDPCVTEEFTKLYVAYKAETNFVDVVPQASRLRLSLNMKFHEVIDPEQRCRDTTNLGRWGNGSVELGIASVAEIPYALSVIRQSLDKQLNEAS